MKGLVKQINFKEKYITIVVDDPNIIEDIKYKFDRLEDMKRIESNFIVDIKELSIRNGKSKINNIKFNKFIIDDIVVTKILGNGDNGIVYRGYDNFFDRDVAIKVWIPNFKKGKKKSNKTRFKEEVKKMANISQQSVTTIYKRDKILNFDLVVMELVEGVTLDEWLDKKHTLYKRSIIARELFLEIEKLHDKEIHHGDLHPFNIMIDSINGIIEDSKNVTKVHIIDFGTSIFSGKINSTERESKLMIETFNRIVPEIENNYLIEVDTKQISPNIITRIYRSALNIIWLLEPEKICHQAMVDISMMTALLPFFNIDSIFNLMSEKLENDCDFQEGDFYEFFIGYLCDISRVLEIEFDINNITAEELYKIYRKEFELYIRNNQEQRIFELLYKFDDYKDILYMDIF